MTSIIRTFGSKLKSVLNGARRVEQLCMVFV